MKRQFIPLNDLKIYDEFHYQSGDSFEVNQQLDGNTTEYHKEGIEMVKDILRDGKKVLPILVQKHDGWYSLLDGFKRSRAHIELGYQFIEAFVCDELDPRGLDPELKEIRACKGGQSEMSWYEKNAQDEKILYWSGDPEKLRIDYGETVHIHWGLYGKYRLTISEEEFRELAKAVSHIWEK